MLRRHVLVPLSALLTGAILLFTSSSALAANPSGAGNGMRISPVRNDLTIRPGTSQTIDIFVQNLTGETATLRGIVNDFTANPDESGTPAILLNGEKAPSHSLKDYVEPINNFTLGPNQTKDVKVTVNIPAGVAGGGYFGVVRFAPASANGNKNVNLTASVGSLLLVTVPGKIVEQMSVASFDVRHVNAGAGTITSGPSALFTSNKNLGAVVRFDNTGNLQEGPFGNVLLKKGTKLLATYQLNNTSPRGQVLPGSIRHFIVPLTKVGSFGRYTVEGNFGYGTTGQLLTAQTSFYVIPAGLLILVIVIVFLILFAIFVLPRLIRGYNRSVVQKAARGRQ